MGGAAGKRGVERGIEAGHGGYPGQQSRHHVDAAQSPGLVQRGQVGGGLDRAAHRGIDDCRRLQVRTAVHDAVADGINPGQAVQERGEGGGGSAGIPVPDFGGGQDLIRRIEQAQLEAARPRVDDEDVHQAGPAGDAAGPGQVQSRTSGMSSPCSRV